jgi:DNA-binding transcriptional MerR regulator
MRIGTVADQAKVNTQTVRYYERIGLLGTPARRTNGYRDYPIETVQLIRFIKRAQKLGFSLTGARMLTGLRHGSGRKCATIRAIATSRLQDLEHRIADMRAMRRVLKQVVAACTNDDADRCPILQALDVGTRVDKHVPRSLGHGNAVARPRRCQDH